MSTWCRCDKRKDRKLSPAKIAMVSEFCKQWRIWPFSAWNSSFSSWFFCRNLNKASAATFALPWQWSIWKWYWESSWAQQTCLELRLFVSIKRQRLLWSVRTSTLCLQPFKWWRHILKAWTIARSSPLWVSYQISAGIIFLEKNATRYH